MPKQNQDPSQTPLSKAHLPKFPIPVGKAQQKLSQAIICGDHELASWIDRAAITGNLTGTEEEIEALMDRLDEVMKPL